MVKSIVLNYKWPPSEIGGLFIDREDINGIAYWYDVIVETQPKKKDK